MTLPPELGWMDAAFLGTLSFFLLAWVQYWKKSLPEDDRIIKAFSVLSSISFSYLLSQVMKMPTPLSILGIILYGLAAAIFGDFAYQFLSSSKSNAFSLPSQNQMISYPGQSKINREISQKAKELASKKEEILKMFAQMEEIKKSLRGEEVIRNEPR